MKMSSARVKIICLVAAWELVKFKESGVIEYRQGIDPLSGALILGHFFRESVQLPILEGSL
jgi:hypothetical protein